LSYSIHGPQTIHPKQFWACDVISDCFEYHRSDLADEQLFTLNSEDLNNLKNSPFVRIKSETLVGPKDNYTFDYFK